MNPEEPLPAGDQTPESTWFAEHYGEAVGHIIDFHAAVGISLEGKRVADIGCGDGIIDLGLAHKARPEQLIGFDIEPTNVDHLLAQAHKEIAITELPAELEFHQSSPEAIPAENASFDHLVTWSAFEHVVNPVAVLKEMRRIIRPDGVMFLQLWPFYHSERGSHLWDWFPEPFHHLNQLAGEISEEARRSDRHPKEWTEMMVREFGNLNRITLDELQRSILASGFTIRRFELYTNPVQLTPELARYPLSVLGISGVKLLATAN